MKQGIIIRVLSSFYTVFDGQQNMVCKARGKFRKNDEIPLAGDLCDFDEREAYIMKLYPRKNRLIRPPVANVDQALIVVSAKEPNFSTLLLDRFLAIVEHENIQPIIVVTKMDLLEQMDELDPILTSYQNAGYPLLLVEKNHALDEKKIKSILENKISVFTGQSGVGKSTFLNTLFPELALRTGEISNVLGRGKHTTRHVELYPVYGGWVADTPGFSSLNLNFSARELAVAYHDFKRLSEQCKFRGCLHLSEPMCAVKQAVEVGEISLERYQHYKIFMKEIQNKKGKC